MLRKLIKYDFKALSRYLIVIHAMLLITAVLGRLLFVGRATNACAFAYASCILL